MELLKNSITDLYNDAYSAIEAIEESSNLTKLTEFCNNPNQGIFTPKFELFHEPEQVNANDSHQSGRSRRAAAKISFHRRDMQEVLQKISLAKSDKDKRKLKLDWWKDQVMPKIKDLWNEQTVLELADFVVDTRTARNSVHFSFRTLNKSHHKDNLRRKR